MLSPTEWNWAGMTGFFYAGLTALLILFMYFMLPETKDRSYEELDIMFLEGIPARQFSKVQVDPYAERSQRIKRE